ncbi:MAG TPA: circadian clock KaiB family protein [Vicinamibacterales bacterium]|nr:circadian clock KaiB family protein [Vicinamibacterales bacterium]
MSPRRRRPLPSLILRLYVAGNAPNSLRATSNIKAICAEHFAEAHTLEVIDMFVHPQRAIADGIIVTPTLLKLSPLPVQRIIGDLSNTAHMLVTLGAR